MKIRVIAPSGGFPKALLELTLKRMKKNFASHILEIDPQVHKRHLFYAGTDEERATALYAAAMDPEVDMIWAARGGYGAARLLHLLESLPKPPFKKRFVGFSDQTALFDFLTYQWGWEVLHGPMPGTEHIQSCSNKNLKSIFEKMSPGVSALKQISGRPKKIEGKLVVGNLVVLHSLANTRFRVPLQNSILMIEDIGEPMYRLDRILHSLFSESLDRPQALIFGELLNCADVPPAGVRKPILFLDWAKNLGDELQIPVFQFKNISHAPGHREGKGIFPYGSICRIYKGAKGTQIKWSPQLS